LENNDHEGEGDDASSHDENEEEGDNVAISHGKNNASFSKRKHRRICDRQDDEEATMDDENGIDNDIVKYVESATSLILRLLLCRYTPTKAATDQHHTLRCCTRRQLCRC